MSHNAEELIAYGTAGSDNLAAWYDSAGTLKANIDLSGNLVLAGTLTGSGNSVSLVEGAAPTGVASSDILYADSTAHRLKMKNNNGSALTVAALESPAFTTPSLGAATATALTGLTSAITPSAAGGALIGTTALPANGIILGTAATNVATITAAAMAAARAITIADPGGAATFAYTNPTTAQVLVNTSIGSSTPSTGAFTTLTASGIYTPTGGIAQATPTNVQHYWAQSGDPSGSVTSGTDTVGIANKLWTTQIFIPCNMSITGLGFLVGTVGGTDKVVLSLYSTAGVLLANTTVAGGGTTVGTAAQFQAIDFTVAYIALGPGNYVVGVNTSGNTGRIRTNPQTGAKSVGVQYSQTTATPAAITPTTGYTVSTAPFVFAYGS